MLLQGVGNKELQGGAGHPSLPPNKAQVEFHLLAKARLRLEHGELPAAQTWGSHRDSPTTCSIHKVSRLLSQGILTPLAECMEQKAPNSKLWISPWTPACFIPFITSNGLLTDY